MGRSDLKSEVTHIRVSGGRSPTDTFMQDTIDTSKYTLTRWWRIRLWCMFFCGLLDRFTYEDDDVYLEGFRDVDTHVTYLTHIREKK